MTAPKKTTTPSVEPPAQAVAQDAHWTVTRERLRNRQRPTLTMMICDDADLKADLESARFVLRAANREATDQPGDAETQAAVAAAQAAVDAAQAAFDEVAIMLQFQALSRPDFEALKKQHPATEEQAEDGFDINIESIAPHLISAASLDGITPDDAREYLDTWSEGEAATLFNTAWQVQGETRVDVGKG